jgi:hypothetical protein
LEAYSPHTGEPSGQCLKKTGEDMSSKLSKGVWAVGALVMSGTLILGSGRRISARPASPEHESSHGKELQGTWRVQVQSYNCQTNAPIGKPFASLLAFADGGTMSETTMNPAFAPGQRTSGFGVWSHEGRHIYSAKSVAFLLFTTPPNPPMSPGFTAGTQTITQNIEFKDGPDQFASEARVEFADTTGTVYRSGCATATTQRLELE